MISCKRSSRIACTASLALRAVAAAFTIVTLTSCNLPGRSTEPTQTPTAGSYAAAQQALSPIGLYPQHFKCPQEGIVDYYNLCFRHEFDFKMSDGKGFTLKPAGGTHCVLLSLSSSELSLVGGGMDGVHGSVYFNIEGKWDFPNVECKLSGTATLNVSVYGRGDPPCRASTISLTVFEHWSEAPIHGECTCIKNCGNPPRPAYPIDVTNPMLPDRGVDLTFTDGNLYDVKLATVGSFRGYYAYEFMPAPGVESEMEPIPLVP